MELICSLIFLLIVWFIYPRKEGKKSIWFGTAGREGKYASSVTKVAWFILRKSAFRAKDLPRYWLVPVCSNLLTTVQSIYHLPSLGIAVQWYGLIAQQYAKTYPFHPAQPALSSRPLSAWGRLESGWRTAGLKHTLTSQYWLKGENTGRMKQCTGSPSFAGLFLQDSWNIMLLLGLTESIFGTEHWSRSNLCTAVSPAGVTTPHLCLQYFQVGLL